jgi:hypothetical protein
VFENKFSTMSEEIASALDSLRVAGRDKYETVQWVEATFQKCPEANSLRNFLTIITKKQNGTGKFHDLATEYHA